MYNRTGSNMDNNSHTCPKCGKDTMDVTIHNDNSGKLYCEQDQCDFAVKFYPDD